LARSFLDDLARLKPDEWTEGPLHDVGQRLAMLLMIQRAVNERVVELQDALRMSMDEDVMPVPGFGRIHRTLTRSSRWRDEHASADFRADVWKAAQNEVAVDKLTGEVDQGKLNIARAVTRELDDALPAFSSLKQAGRRRLRIDIDEYRIFDDVYKIELEMEDEL